MKWSLFLLILMGQCFLVMCQLYKYHLVKNKRTWQSAQNHCRNNYTDLTTVYDMTDKERLPDKGDEAWIRLYTNQTSTNMWQWSLPGVEYKESETELEEDNQNNNKNCVFIENNVWKMDKCDTQKKFICYKGKFKFNDCNEEKDFIRYEDKIKLIEQNKTWQEAMDYCRENHNDLISILNKNQQRWVQEKAKRAQTEFIWLGLRYTCTLGMWFWVTGEDFTYGNWASDPLTHRCYSGVAMKTGDGMWVTKRDNEMFNFICMD